MFVGKAVEVVEGPTQRTTFAVTETLKGRVGASVPVEGGGLCGATFVKGQSYLVYLGDGPAAGLCSGIDLLAHAKPGLAYARGAGKRTRAVLEGYVTVGGDSTRAPLPNIVVRANNKATARTDRTGAYRFELPPGTYTLAIADDRLKLVEDATVDLIDAKACGRRELMTMWNGRVRGRVLGVDGKPAAGVQVTLVATQGANQFATTNANGDYEVSGVPAGEYTVTAVAASTSAKRASPIKLSQAALVQKIDLKLAP